MEHFKKDISVISMVSNESVYENWLKTSYEKQQEANAELIPLYNENNSNFKSARCALNYGAKIAQGKYLLFAHQDIKFLNNYVLKQLAEYADSLDDFGVIGVAGCGGGATVFD